MLYIKFEINNLSKYADFQKLFDHMQETRQEGYELEYMINADEIEDTSEPDYDWENMSDDEFQKLKDMWEEEIKNSKPLPTPAMKRYLKFIPDYANSFLESYVSFDKKTAGDFSFETLGIFNYLEVTFEVDMDNLEILTDNIGIVEFSTGNLPYGGMERFIMTLKAFDLNSIECYNGFGVFKFDWKTDYVFEDIDLPERTKEYVARYKK